MSTRNTAPCGSWASPLSAELIAASAVAVREPVYNGDDVFWLEGRPAEGGRYVVVRRTPDGRTADVTPPDFNARTRVHEYGGGSFLVHDGTVYFSNFANQRVYRQPVGGEPGPITPEAPLRFADYAFDAKRGRLVCVREDHTVDTPDKVINTIVALDVASGGAGTVLVSGDDFYSNPRLSADGSRLCWLTWNHPNMPWDGTELWLAEVSADGSLGQATLVAGGLAESIFQPEWSPDGSLYFASDRSGWWNLYRWANGEVERLTEAEAEFGVPHWQFGMRTYAIESAGCIVCSYRERDGWKLGTLDPESRQLTPIDLPFSAIQEVQTANGKAVFLGGSATTPQSVIELNLATRKCATLKSSTDLELDPEFVSAAEAIEFPTTGGETAHAFYYAPKSPDYLAPTGEKPPLVVFSHGGPTGSTSSTLTLSIQFWTSRGIAVADVNYGGSTGYGRAYRDRLKGAWGIVDVDDCVNAALYLVRRGDVDGDRLAIRGGSAGGYTTLASLAFRDIFKAGASYYGVGDLEALAKDTHKFESHYLDGLIGPYPERRDLYMERSPVYHMEGFNAPMIVLQGLEDAVVPPSQAEEIIAALREKKVPVASIFFDGEQHGFRKAESMIKALNSELYFYSRIFGFGLPGNPEGIPIENL